MTAVFFDSNILVYAYTSNDRRRIRARELLNAGGTISVQCLNEFATVGLRKLGMGWDRVTEALSIIAALCVDVVQLDVELHRHGIAIAQRYQLSIYDSMIIAAALKASCAVIYTEDLHDGLLIEGRVRVVNPFAAAA